MEAGPEKLLFDCGRGCTIRLTQKHVPLRDVKLFLTHLHSDHLNGIPDLWLTGWLGPPWGQRKTPLVMIGPVGTKNMADHLEQAFMPDILIRMADEKLPRDGIRFDAKDLTAGIVYEANGVKVTAFEVDHGDEIKPCYGYRIDYRGRSVVLSGDTRYNQNVIKYGTGADLLIHEVAMAKPEVAQMEAAKRILAHHTSPQEAGRAVFRREAPPCGLRAHQLRLEAPGPLRRSHRTTSPQRARPIPGRSNSAGNAVNLTARPVCRVDALRPTTRADVSPGRKRPPRSWAKPWSGRRYPARLANRRYCGVARKCNRRPVRAKT